MIDIIKNNMDSVSLAEFEKDYEKLIRYKSDKKLWRLAMSSKTGRVPLLKELFDNIGNKYNYNSYRNSVYDNKDLYYIIIGFKRKERNNEEVKECLLLHYSIENYIAFMVEWILFEYIKQNTTYSVYKNNVLDFEKKADLLCNGKYYQIKNKSFIYDTDYTMNYVYEYKKANKNLYFIFYTIDEDNIYFCGIDNKPFLFIDNIDGFTFAYDYTKITLKDFIKYLE